MNMDPRIFLDTAHTSQRIYIRSRFHTNIRIDHGYKWGMSYSNKNLIFSRCFSRVSKFIRKLKSRCNCIHEFANLSYDGIETNEWDLSRRDRTR